MSRLAIVSTQMQLINCIEFLFKFSKRIEVLIVLCHSDSRCDQLKKMLELQDICYYFDTIQYIIIRNNGVKGVLSQYMCKKQLTSIAKKYRVDECLIGNNFPIQNRYFIYKIAQFNPECIFYVCDDGLASLSSYENRNNQLKNKTNSYPLNSRTLELVYMFSRVNKYIPPQFIYFTIYNFNDNHVDKIIYNPYSFLRSHPFLFNSEIELDKYNVVFLGQPLLEHKVVSLDIFNNYIRYVIESSYGHKVLYIAHPQENITNAIFETDIRDSIDVVKLNYPIETLVPMLNLKYVYSFFTSALVTLKYMNPEIRLNALFLKEIMDKHNEYSERVVKVYEYLSSFGIQIKRLDN